MIAATMGQGSMFAGALFGAGVLLAAAGAPARATGIEATISQPLLDRWMYPFNEFTPRGARPTMPTFWTVRDTRFDDRDAEVLVVFDTTGSVPAGFRAAAYRIDEATLRMMVQVDSPGEAFIYDPTPDPLASYLDPAGVPFAPDPDPGRPVELFAAAFRGTNPQGTPWSVETYGENSPFAGVAPPDPAAPWRSTRAAYPVAFDASGQAVDASNNVTRPASQGGPFQPAALAAAVDDGGTMAPGDAVPDRTVFRFAIDASAPGVQAYLAQGLSRGRVALAASSLHDSIEFGGGPPIYPRWMSKENTLPGAQGPRLTLRVRLCAADVATSGSADPQAGPDGFLTGEDFDLFIVAFFAELVDAQTGRKIADIATAGSGDLGPDGFLTGEDFDRFIVEFFSGCP
ncbi:MAG: hypothetical protein KIT68_06490 [Phycisphaeraceae bacterium]|nr:hypothetical protein [Phycisphaeraceae bacterium]